MSIFFDHFFSVSLDEQKALATRCRASTEQLARIAKGVEKPSFPVARRLHDATGLSCFKTFPALFFKHFFSLSVSARHQLAKQCGTSYGYLKNVARGHKMCSADLAIRLEKATAITGLCEALRPDTDWAYIRSSPARVKRSRKTPPPRAGRHRAPKGAS